MFSAAASITCPCRAERGPRCSRSEATFSDQWCACSSSLKPGPRQCPTRRPMKRATIASVRNSVRLEAGLATEAVALERAAPSSVKKLSVKGKPPRARRDPHPWGLDRVATMQLGRAAADQLVEDAPRARPARFPPDRRVGRDAGLGLESVVEPLVELAGTTGGRTVLPTCCRILDGDLHQSCGEQPLDDAHRLDETCSLW